MSTTQRHRKAGPMQFIRKMDTVAACESQVVAVRNENERKATSRRMDLIREDRITAVEIRSS